MTGGGLQYLLLKFRPTSSSFIKTGVGLFVLSNEGEHDQYNDMRY